jgi:hypothetical protein
MLIRFDFYAGGIEMRELTETEIKQVSGAILTTTGEKPSLDLTISTFLVEVTTTISPLLKKLLVGINT